MEDKLINTIEVAGATVCGSTLLLDREREKGKKGGIFHENEPNYRTSW